MYTLCYFSIKFKQTLTDNFLWTIHHYRSSEIVESGLQNKVRRVNSPLPKLQFLCVNTKLNREGTRQYANQKLKINRINFDVKDLPLHLQQKLDLVRKTDKPKELPCIEPQNKVLLSTVSKYTRGSSLRRCLSPNSPNRNSLYSNPITSGSDVSALQSLRDKNKGVHWVSFYSNKIFTWRNVVLWNLCYFYVAPTWAFSYCVLEALRAQIV